MILFPHQCYLYGPSHQSTLPSSRIATVYYTSRRCGPSCGQKSLTALTLLPQSHNENSHSTHPTHPFIRLKSGPATLRLIRLIYLQAEHKRESVVQCLRRIEFLPNSSSVRVDASRHGLMVFLMRTPSARITALTPSSRNQSEVVRIPRRAMVPANDAALNGHERSWCVPCHAGLEESGTKHVSSNPSYPTAAQTMRALASHLRHTVKVGMGNVIGDIPHEKQRGPVTRIARAHAWEGGIRGRTG